MLYLRIIRYLNFWFMKKAFTISLLFVFLGLSVWAESDSADASSTEAIGLEKAIDDNVSVVIEDTPLDINVVSNDLAPGFSEIVVTIPAHFATLEPQASGFNYIPNENFYSTQFNVPVDSFQYTLVFDDTTQNQSAWVFIDSVRGVNDVPQAALDSFMIKQDSGAIYATVLANDIDRDRAGLKIEVLTGAEVKHGTVSYHDNVFEYTGDNLLFPNDGISPSNKNLLKTFDQRDMSYMFDTVFVYEPDSGFYGYDTLQYIISEYRPQGLTFFQESSYEFVWNVDADTAMVIFYVEPHDYLPVAMNDTIYQMDTVLYKMTGGPLQEADTVATVSFYPMANDIDGDSVPANPSALLKLPYIIAQKSDQASATTENDTVIFEHDIAEYDSLTHSIVYRKDTNIAYINGDQLSYTYAPGFSGVDSLFYCVVEKDLVNSVYPNRFRGDTSELGIIYFVVEPVNDASFPASDTLDYDLSKIESTKSFKNIQYFDVLSNDLDIDNMDSTMLSALKRLMGDDYKVEFESYSELSVKSLGNADPGFLQTENEPVTGDVRLINDSVYYNYKPLYSSDLLIDSFEYIIYNGDVNVASQWAFIRHKAVEANDDIIAVGEPFMEDRIDSLLASNLLLTGNDIGYDTLFILYNADSTLNTPSKSSYAMITQPESGEANYYYHEGFKEVDSFQYVISDLLTNDTAWVYITNAPVNAEPDTFFITESPFAVGSGNDIEIDVLSNDFDLEQIKNIIPFNGDTLETDSAYITISTDDDYQVLNYKFKPNFFLKDSFLYTITDVPAFFADKNLFTQDSTWVLVVDTGAIVDSDGDGIVNTMEDNISGYQLGEDTIGIGEHGIPNYLNWDVDGDNFPDGGDCDGDGIINILDADKCDGSSLQVSTAFTPNGDGVNDLFIIPELMLSNGTVMEASIKIYNRWGSLVYENEAYGQGGDWWDGNLGDVSGLSIGNELPNGVYLYYLVFNGVNKKEGYVHIQR